MEKKVTFFFFGFGQSAKYFLKEFSKTKTKFNFFSTNTSKTHNIYFNKKKYRSFKFKDNSYDKSLVQSLAQSEYILVSIPPQGSNDVVLKRFSKNLTNLKF